MSEPKAVLSTTVIKKKEESCGTSSNAENANAQSAAGVTGPAPTTSLQVRFKTSERLENNRVEGDLHISQAEPPGEALKRAHSAVQELDWLWRSC